MLTAEQAKQCVEAGIPVAPQNFSMQGFVLPIVKGSRYMRIVKFGTEQRPVFVFIYTDVPMEEEHAADMAIDYVTDLSRQIIPVAEANPILII